MFCTESSKSSILPLLVAHLSLDAKYSVVEVKMSYLNDKIIFNEQIFYTASDFTLSHINHPFSQTSQPHFKRSKATCATILNNVELITGLFSPDK